MDARESCNDIEASNLSLTAETALIALADPIIWKYNHCRKNGEYNWQGEYLDTSYYLSPPAMPGEPDTPLESHLWRITISDASVLIISHAPTPEAAKALCTRYTLTGDHIELEMIKEKVAAEALWYRQALHTAVNQLTCFSGRELNLLSPEGTDDKPSPFSALGRRGSYVVRWDAERRWVVTFEPSQKKYGVRTIERCFLTRTFADYACCVHNSCGRWIGVLKKGDYFDEQF